MPVSYDDPAVQTHDVCPGQDGCFPAYLTGIVANLDLRLQSIGTPIDEAIWPEVTGFTEEQFRAAVRAAAGGRTQDFSASGMSQSLIAYPDWLYLPKPESVDADLVSTANWVASSFWPNVDLREPLRAAWIAFAVGSYRKAATNLGPVLEQVGTTWGPTRGTDSNALWAWLRLVAILDTLIRDQAVDSVLAAVSQGPGMIVCA